MNILLISPLHPKLKTKNSKSLPKYQAQFFWVKALKALGHQVKTFPLTQRQSKLLNNFKLKKVIQTFKPDQIFLSAGIDKLSPLAKTVFFCGVPPRYLSPDEIKSASKARLIVVNCTSRINLWKKFSKAKIIALPFSAVDPDYFKPDKVKKDINLCFVATLFPKRQQQLKKLIQAGINIKIWGWIPPKSKLLSGLKPFYQGEAWGSQVIDIYQRSKMALNLNPHQMKDGANLRTFEIPACKTLQFIDKINPKYYLAKKEIIVFASPEDLKAKINYLQNHPEKTKKIINAGYEKTINHHTFINRFKTLMNLL